MNTFSTSGHLRLRRMFHAHGPGIANDSPTGIARRRSVLKGWSASAAAATVLAGFSSTKSSFVANRSSWESETISTPSRNLNEFKPAGSTPCSERVFRQASGYRFLHEPQIAWISLVLVNVKGLLHVAFTRYCASSPWEIPHSDDERQTNNVY